MKFKHEYAKQLADESRLHRWAIAEDCNITEGTLSQYLNGHQKPSEKVVDKLATSLKVPAKDLWVEDDVLEAQKAS